MEKHNGIVYNINIDEEFKKILRKQLVKSKSQINIIKNHKSISNDINKSDNEQKSFDAKLEGEEGEGNTEKEIVKEEKEDTEKGFNREENIKLKPFDENQIKVLIKYYFFIKDLKKAIKESSSQNKTFIAYDCYLINYDWMENYKLFYLYDELVKIIEKVVKEIIDKKKINDIKYKEQIVLENLTEDYIKKIINKEKLYDETYFEIQKSIQFSFRNLNDKVVYPTNFEIISCDIFDLIRQNRTKKLELYKKEFIKRIFM